MNILYKIINHVVMMENDDESANIHESLTKEMKRYHLDQQNEIRKEKILKQQETQRKEDLRNERDRKRYENDLAQEEQDFNLNDVFKENITEYKQVGAPKLLANRVVDAKSSSKLKNTFGIKSKIASDLKDNMNSLFHERQNLVNTNANVKKVLDILNNSKGEFLTHDQIDKAIREMKDIVKNIEDEMSKLDQDFLREFNESKVKKAQLTGDKESVLKDNIKSFVSDKKSNEAVAKFDKQISDIDKQINKMAGGKKTQIASHIDSIKQANKIITDLEKIKSNDLKKLNKQAYASETEKDGKKSKSSKTDKLKNMLNETKFNFKNIGLRKGGKDK